MATLELLPASDRDQTFASFVVNDSPDVKHLDTARNLHTNPQLCQLLSQQCAGCAPPRNEFTTGQAVHTVLCQFLEELGMLDVPGAGLAG
jgi:hypothetical protein